MPSSLMPNFRQQRAIEAIERAATDLDLAIRTHAPDGALARHARAAIQAAVAELKQAILQDDP